VRSRILPAVALSLLSWLSPGIAAEKPVVVDRIVAVVNKEVITLSELDEAIGAAERNLRRQGTQAPERSVLERQMLERLILDKVQLQLARDTGIRVDDVQLDRAVQRVAEQNHLTLSAFRSELEKGGVPFDGFRDDLREQITLQRLRDREVDDKIQVSDTEIDLYLEESKAQSGPRDEYNLAHLLIAVPDQATPDRVQAARAKAEKAREEAAAGGDFAAIAARVSDAPDALRGGSLGWRSAERLPDLFTQALAKMKPGDVSGLLRSSAGFHVLKLVDRRGEKQDAPVQQTKLRHILIRTGETVSEDEARRRLSGLRQRLVAGADFAALARANSDDGSAARGGELDWVYPGDTVPEFERAYQELKVGEISQPVKTQFGYHLIQVMERRTSDTSPERKRLEARKVLRERKSDEAYQQWLRQLRDQAYVDLRLDER
jgi:peptidyl-prolyl cis-trans isomerase SurA